MVEVFVAKRGDLKTGERTLVRHNDTEIGVFNHGGVYYAYANVCVHQGGPACEGLTIAAVEERIAEDKTSRGLYFSETRMHFVCPWHGAEYDITTGECVSNRKLRLARFDVIERDESIYVSTR